MAIVQKAGHQIGDRINSPAYLDANFLVFYAVGSHQASTFQTVARNVMGDLLAQRVTILISLITIEEAWWATLHELYFRHIWHPSSPGIHFNFNRSIAKACWSQLMQYKDELKGIIRSLQELQNKGADIHFTPEDQTSFEVCENVPDYMYKHNLLSADALHLSLALSEATTLITFDVNDFKNVLDQSKNLTIILLP